MSRVHLAEILELPVAERGDLVQAAWDGIPELPEAFPLCEAEREKLDRRPGTCRQDPEAASP